jgi:hypothetical protein
VEVPVVAVSWLDMYEVHAVRSSTPSRAALVLVSEFVQTEGPVSNIKGIRLNLDQERNCWSELAALRTALQHFDAGYESVTAPRIDINHGDAVARLRRDGIDVALVAAAGDPWRGPAWAWPFELALLSARDQSAGHENHLFWSEPESALRGMKIGLLGWGSKDGLAIWRGIVTAAANADLVCVGALIGRRAESDEARRILGRVQAELRRLAADDA